jgi:2-iminobutanoate/2-iminopropanoate deaminase
MRFPLPIPVYLALSMSVAQAEVLSPNGVKTLAPEGAIKTTGTWALGTRAGDFVYVAGMRGIDPKTNALVPGDEARIRQSFLNMKLIAESEGATLRDAVRIVVYVTDMFRFRPLVNKVQEELWGKGPYPPRRSWKSTDLIRTIFSRSKGLFTRLQKSNASRNSPLGKRPRSAYIYQSIGRRVGTKSVPIRLA